LEKTISSLDKNEISIHVNNVESRLTIRLFFVSLQDKAMNITEETIMKEPERVQSMFHYWEKIYGRAGAVLGYSWRRLRFMRAAIVSACCCMPFA
jgi:hypothetical protein